MKTQISSNTLVLIVISIAINIIGGQLSSIIKLPIFLDSIGTIISALIAGPWIALLTGLLSNLLSALVSGPIAIAFAPIAMVIGLTAGLLARADLFTTLPRVILSGVIITLALTLIAVPIRVYLFGGTSGSGADFIIAYLHAVGEGLLLSVSFTVIGTNLVDKVLSAIIAWLLIRRLPQRALRNFPQIARVR